MLFDNVFENIPNLCLESLNHLFRTLDIVCSSVCNKLFHYERFEQLNCHLFWHDNLATGSARSVSGFDVYKAIEHCRDLLENFGGHTYAAGLSMKVENVEEFTRRFETYVTEHILPEQTSAVIDIDAEIDFRDITPKFHADLKKFNPFGPDNHKPIFCTHNVYDYGTSKVVGRDQEHIKLELVDNKSNNVMNGIAFGQSSQARYIKTKRSFDICYTIEENTHKRGEVQLQIEDIKPSEE